MQKNGSLSINSENIFPIIKKWLYSDHDIFIRELVSNACDAITKLKKLSLLGEFDGNHEEYKIIVKISPKHKTIQFIDNGLGMSAAEVEEYINQIAFSGAKDFMEKYKDKANDDQIIGHFGLGFYSAFMVADKVSIETKSYQDEPAVSWVSHGGTDFSMQDGDKQDRGTEITLYLNEDSYEFSNEYRVREILEKYCSFMPVDIYLEDADKAETKEEAKEEKADTVAEAQETATEESKIEAPKPINDKTPLWTKHPNECSKEDYIDFYRKVFRDYKEPLFWIHLNMDYPFNLKGILYFPKINTEYDSLEGTIKLYNNQVFIADNIKEVIPEFLMLLKGVIDCPDLPLNVSRSALQNDGFVKKISDYISKKIADKLNGMFKVEREEYEKYWEDIAPFIKYGYLKDEKFADKIEKSILFKTLDDAYKTLEDLTAKTEIGKEAADTETTVEDSAKDATAADSTETKLYYVSDTKAQSQYIAMFKEIGKEAVVLSHHIDAPFISHLEMKHQGVRFFRIDSSLSDEMKSSTLSEEEKKSYEEISEKIKESLGNKTLHIEFEDMKNTDISAMITLSEESRRMQDMMKQYAMPGMDMSMFGAQDENLILNKNNPLVKKLIEGNEHFDTIAKQLYDLAKLSHGSLPVDRMAEFIKRSNELMLHL